MTRIEKAKLFLAPLFSQKLLTFLACIKFSGYAIYAIAAVIIIKGCMHALEAGNQAIYIRYVWMFMVFFGLYSIIMYVLRTTDWPHLYHHTERWIYRRYIPQIIDLDNNYLEKIGTGKLISILRDGRKVWIDQLSFLLRETSKILITGIFLFYTLAQVDWKYACALILGLVVMHIGIVWIDSNAHKYRRIRTQEQGELSRKLVRVIMSKNEILQNNSLSTELQSLMCSVDLISDSNNKINRSLFFIYSSVRFFAVGLRLLILLVVGYGVFQNSFTMADFATTMALIIVFENFLFDSTEFYKNFTKDFTDIEKLWETLDDAPKMRGYYTGETFVVKDAAIEVRNIIYGYDDVEVFTNLSLTFEKGKKTALVGASGGGKTTLMKLIAGYLHPQSGTVSILGNQLDKTALKTYYPHIGYLTQDPGVFDATIRENLMSVIVNTHDNPETKLIEALRLAHCDFVFDLVNGLDTEIGERGVRLSGGQKQRLAIAKIFLKNPEIILLDEPTSALDSFSEEAITTALDELFKGRTVIIVAHRLQTVRKADDIIVLEHGGIIERGNHDELVKQGGTYAKMLELQSGF